jgi:hypothetical protein
LLHAYLGSLVALATELLATTPEVQMKKGNKIAATAAAAAAMQQQQQQAADRPLAYGVVFLRLGGGLGCFSPAIDNYIERHCVLPHQRLLHPRLYLEQLAMAA